MVFYLDFLKFPYDSRIRPPFLLAKVKNHEKKKKNWAKSGEI
jgi:hypothetical protein